MHKPRTIHLTPPQLSGNHIHEKITCIRPHRERLFRVDTEIINNKLICHNYGQGGAGWTFLFGCVNKSVALFESEIHQNSLYKKKPICVVGAGCYGLLTAILLARAGYTVRIVAKDTYISSDKAAGFFFPRHRKMSTLEEINIFKDTGMQSYKTYLDIINNKHTFIKAGPRIVPAYYGLDIDPGFGPYIKEGLVNEPERVRIDFGNGKAYDMMEYQIVFINPSQIFAELQGLVQEMDIPTEYRELHNLSDLPEDIIFNCSGMGAKKLAPDPRIIPVQGHLITLKNQSDLSQINYMINTKVTMVDAQGQARDEIIYYAPKGEGVLGITFKRGEGSLDANPHEFDRLTERCKNYF